MNTKIIGLFFLFMAVSGVSYGADADLEFIPSSRHQQFTTYGLFIEDGDTSILMKNADNAWAAIGAAIPVLEARGWSTTPQLFAFGSANVGYHLDSSQALLLTQTIDARVGLDCEFNFTDKTRMLVGWTHQSGHVSDNIDDPSMVGPNLGNELIQVRLIHDIHNTGDDFRLGGSLKPIVGSTPKMKVFGANQFAEWFPFGTAGNPRHPTPFVAGGFEEYGVTRMHLNSHAQIGAYIGSHMEKEHLTIIRFVLGYYNGLDPRLKFAQYKLQTAEFGYAGFFVSL